MCDGGRVFGLRISSLGLCMNTDVESSLPTNRWLLFMVMRSVDD